MNQEDQSKTANILWKILPIAALIFCLLFFYRAFIAGNVFGWDDDLYVFFPGASYFATSIADGNFPFWLPGLRCGMPFYSDVQMGVFYPLKWLLVLFVQDGELSQQAYQSYLVFQYFIGGTLFYFLMRMHKMCRTSSATGALVYCFSGFTARHIIFFASVEVMLWLPLVLMAIKFYFRHKSVRRVLLISLAVLMTFLPGFPQVTVYVSYFSIAYWLVLAIHEQQEKGSAWKGICIGVLREMAVAVAAFLFAIAMGAIAFFPAFENWKLSHRSAYGYDEVADTSMPFYYVVNMFFPNFTGVMKPTGDAVQYWGFNRDCIGFERYKTAYWHYWDLSCYAGQIGIIALLYSIVFIRSFWKTPLRFVCTIAAVLAFWFMLGRYGGLFRLLYEVLPGISSFRGPGRMSCVMNAAQAVLAAYFIGDLLRSEHLSRIRRFLLVVLGGYILFLVLFLISGKGWADPLSNSKVFYFSMHQIFVGIGFAGALTAVSFLLGRDTLKKFRGGILCALFLIVFFDLYAAHGNFHKGKVQASGYFADKGNLIAQMQEFQKQHGICRFAQVRNGQINESVVMPRNTAYSHDIEVPEGYVLFNLYSIGRIRRQTNLPEETIRDLLNIGIIAEQTPQGIGLRVRSPIFPRASFYSNITAFDSYDELFKTVSSETFDHKQQLAVLKSDIAGKMNSSATAGVRSSCKVKKIDNNTWSIACSANDAGILFFSQGYYPGWKAQTQGGQNLDVIEVFGGLTGVILPSAYTGEITLRFAPSVFIRGAFISAVLVGIILVVFAIPFIRKIKERLRNNP